MARLLVTRPEAEAQALRQILATRGHAVDCAPLLAIRPLETVSLPLEGVTALLFTSANGVRAFAAATPRRDITVYAVGPASATAARAAGFTQVEAAGGDVDRLAALVRTRHQSGGGALLHAAGVTLAGDLQAMLRQDGYDVRRVTLYDAVAATALPAEVERRFGAGEYDAALFFSPRTATTFVTLAAAAGIAAGAGQTDALCLSANVAAVMEKAVTENLPWRRIAVAASPTEDDMLDLL